MKKDVNLRDSFICISVVCIITAVIQGTEFVSSYKSGKTICIFSALIVYSIIFAFHVYKKDLRERAVFLIIFGAMLTHSYYVIVTGIYDRQHDIGNITLLNDGLINGGHLGYIEYFVKNHHMPDFAPFDVFAYYHPPFHHILASIMVSLSLRLGVAYETAFENVQVMTLFYFGLMCMTVYATLCKLIVITTHIESVTDHLQSHPRKELLCALSLVAFHPSLLFMSGYLNNDMLTLLMISLIIYANLCYTENKSTKNLLMIAVSLGIGAICKMNACIYAFPTAVVFLMHIKNVLKEKQVSAWVRRYLVFLFVCGGIGLSFTVRNIIRFHEKPGILSANSDSLQYMGADSLITRLGLPRTLDLEYPFHSEYAKASHNVWLITLKTSLFSEMRPDIGDLGLFLSRIVILTGLVLAIMYLVLILSGFRIIFMRNRESGVFLYCAFMITVMSFIAFVIKYPYTCSCDFRYIASTLFFAAFSLLFAQAFTKRFINILTIFLLITSNVFIFFFALGN